MFVKALRSFVLKSHVLLAIAWHSLVGYMVGKMKGRDPLLAYLRDIYAPHIVRILAWYGIPISVQGGVVSQVGGVLVIAPHESMLDTIIGHLPFLGGRPAYVAKADLFNIPLFGACMHMAGMIPVKEGEMRTMLRNIKARLEEGRVVIVFPEAKRTPPPHHLERYAQSIQLFSRVAEKMNAPVIVVDFGRWYEVWGPPKTLFTANPQPVTVYVHMPGTLIDCHA